MIINSHPPISPALNREPVRPQNTADSSPETTVIQDQKTIPVPDVRVVQQSNEIANSNSLKDPKLDLKQETESQPLDAEDKQAATGEEKTKNNTALTDDERRQVQQLADRDREVRAHEQAHLSAAGSRATSGASFSYTEGPDGRRYATGGEVTIDTSPVQGDPEATLRAAELVQRAALAPAEPSAQDRQVAAAANTMAQVASAELSQQRAEETREAQSSEEPSAPVADDAEVEVVNGAPVESSDTDGEQSAEVVVDTRDVQTQNRQQQLEDAFNAVQRGLEDDIRGANLDSFNPAAQAGSSAQSPAGGAALQSRQNDAGVAAVAQEVRSAAVPAANVEEGAQGDSVREALVVSGDVVSASASTSERADTVEASPEAAQSDPRDEQVKDRQQQLEGAFSAGAQGLGGEPKGANLDYFL